MKSITDFKGKNVLVTGNTGFKGSWLSLWLSKLGANVSGFALEPPTRPSMYEALELNKLVQHHYGDVRDKVRFNAVMNIVQPEYVFHLAAQPIVKMSFEYPQLTFETNSIGTLNLLEACKKFSSIRSIVVVTTDKVYKNVYPYDYTELSELGASEDPYSASKACAEIIVSSLGKQFTERGVHLATVRAGNVLGGGDWSPNRIIPDMVRALTENNEICIYSPEATRPWQYVLDCLYGYMLVSINDKSGPWNFGPKSLNCVNVERLVKDFISAWGSGTYSVVPKEFEESICLKLKTAKAKKELGWEAKLDVDQIISEAVNWYKTFYEHPKNLMDVTLSQIKNYEMYVK